MTATVPSRVDSPTEDRNAATVGIDRLSTTDVLRLLAAEDATVPAAVAAALPELARAVDLVVHALRAGGRVHVVGAGTSGRLAALDADELGPTYGLEPGRWIAHVAAYGSAGSPGGSVGGSVGSADGEDDGAAGTEVGRRAATGDVVVGVSASGRTPFAVQALREAGARGAATVLVSGNPGAAAGSEVDVHVAVHTGPEAVTGSTRMKAGTAQKMVLTALSTAAMVRSGRTWSNLMVGAVATNAKLRGRVAAALGEATGEPAEACAAALADADGDGRVALLALLSGRSSAAARAALASAGGHLREALAGLAPSPSVADP
jgi:N-acetylmuramic acid 6-phosphate etherase